MILLNFTFLHQFCEYINILYSEIHASISQRGMYMCSIACKVYVSLWHFLNNSIIYHILGTPFLFLDHEPAFRYRLEIIRRISHQSYVILFYRNDNHKVLSVNDSFGVHKWLTPLNLCVTEINVRVECFAFEFQTKHLANRTMSAISC